MLAGEYSKLKNYFKPGDICAVVFLEKTKYRNPRTGLENFKSVEKKEILELEEIAGDSFKFENEILIYYKNIKQLKKINARSAITGIGNFQAV